MKAADRTVELLAAAGVTHVFEVVGGTIAPLVDALDRRSAPRLVSMRHEQGAAFAAEGAARMTGAPGVAMATSGPGATNLLTGVGSCFFDSIPAVFLCGQVSSNELRGERAVRQQSFQETDIVAMAAPVTKAAWRPGTAAELVDSVGEALALARSGRPGPVLLDLPMDLQGQDVVSAVAREPEPAPALPAADAVARVLADLRRAQRPLILAGGGIRAAGATDAFRRFAEAEGVPVVHSLMGVDVLPAGHPLRGGMIGTYGNRWANTAMAEADAVLVLGSRLDIRQTGADVVAFAGDRVIHHVDCDAAEINNRVTGCHALVSDLGAFLAEASDQAAETPSRAAWGARLDDLRRQWPDTDELRGITGINPNAFMHALSRAAARTGGYVVDVGQHQMWAAQSLDLGPDQRFLTSGGMGAMGFALPAGIGAALAAGRPMVVIAGDGGLQLNIQELQTISETQAPVTVVVIDNGSHGMVRQFQDSHFEGRTRSSQRGYSAPDFARVAAAYGIPATTVSAPASLERALAAAVENPPHLLHVIVDPAANAYPKLAFGRPMSEMEPQTAPLPLQVAGPRLSICIPTHGGRRDELATALGSLVEQTPHGVEICVSDNASEDGTEALVARLARDHPGRIVYRRNERNLGAGPNILASVDMARGEWCWLFSSDDAAAPGAVRAVLEAVERRDDLVGVTLGRANCNRDLSQETEPDFPAVLPRDPERRRTFADGREALAELGTLACYMTSQVVRRSAWQAAVREEPEIGSRFYPHTELIGRMLVAGRGSWLWIPSKLVLARNGNVDFAATGGDSLETHLLLSADLSRIWSGLLGPRDPVRRELMRRSLEMFADPVWTRRIKARPDHTLRTDVRMVLGFARSFRSSPGVLAGGLPRVAIPHGVARLRGRFEERLRRPMPALPASSLMVRVGVELPKRLGAGRNLHLSCDVENISSRVFRSAPPHPVRLAVRWQDAEGREVRTTDRAAFRSPLRPGATTRVDIVSPTPLVPGRYLLTVGLVQELVAWFEEADAANVTARWVTVEAH